MQHYFQLGPPKQTKMQFEKKYDFVPFFQEYVIRKIPVISEVTQATLFETHART